MLVGTREQFQWYDQLLIEKYGWKIEKMIHTAANALLSYIPKDEKIVIISGKGNNGADGLALAYLLQKNVSVYVLGDLKDLSKGNLYYYKKLQALGILINHDLKKLENDINQSSVIIDGIFGTGFHGELKGLEKEAVEIINRFSYSKNIISIDIPSGLNANTGEVTNIAIKATSTITFVASKTGYLNPNAKSYVGQLMIKDLNFPEIVKQEVGFATMLDDDYFSNLIKERSFHGYKGTYGTLSCHIGSHDYPGAAIISVGAALHTGCGMVQLCSSDFVKSLVIQKYPEIVLKKDLNHIDAYLFGCGKGNSEATKNELETLLKSISQPILIDADGINVLSEYPDLLNSHQGPVVLTPHIGEMKRLNSKDSVIAAIEFSRQYQVIMVLKGPHTMVTDGKSCYRIPSGNKAMATAGMGDCLAGIIASLLASHYDVLDAALLGTYIHGRVGDELAKSQYTVLASEMIEHISEMMKKIA